MRFITGVIVGIWLDQSFRIPNVEKMFSDLMNKLDDKYNVNKVEEDLKNIYENSKKK